MQIASAVGVNARVMVFDEPTSSLSEPEAQRLFKLIEELRTRGVTMIYVSHRMPEVFRLCDRDQRAAGWEICRHARSGGGDAGSDRADDDRADGRRVICRIMWGRVAGRWCCG